VAGAPHAPNEMSRWCTRDTGVRGGSGMPCGRMCGSGLTRKMAGTPHLSRLGCTVLMERGSQQQRTSGQDSVSGHAATSCLCCPNRNHSARYDKFLERKEGGQECAGVLHETVPAAAGTPILPNLTVLLNLRFFPPNLTVPSTHRRRGRGRGGRSAAVGVESASRTLKLQLKARSRKHPGLAKR